MNALAYALLSMLVRKPCTGYELKELLEVFWQAKHSQIYPLLTKLQKDGLLTFERIEQSSKPDKKVYSITEKGLKVLKEWMFRPANPAVIRDEFLIKVYALWLVDRQSAKVMFEERRATYQSKIRYREEQIQIMKQEFGDGVLDHTSRVFGRYLLFQRKLRQEEEEVSWCDWVMDILDKTNKTNQTNKTI